MGLLHRERERGEMYLLLILLVSPAFGRPSSDQFDIGEDISNQLESFISFNNETREILDNSKLFENVVKKLLEAESDIIEMQTKLKTLEIDEIQFNNSYFEEYNKAKSYLRETRQKLRKLADRTVTDVRDLKQLLGALDETNDPVYLKFSINRMKELMIETLKSLKESLEKYYNALESFEILNAKIKAQNINLEKILKKDSAETQELIELEIVNQEELKEDVCAIPFFCPIFVLFSESITKDRIAKYYAEIEKLKRISDRMFESGINFDKTIKVAIDVLTKEIELITIWNKSAKSVSNNIEEYPVEFLRKYKSVRNIFISGLDKLKNAAERFLAQPKDILNLD